MNQPTQSSKQSIQFGAFRPSELEPVAPLSFCGKTHVVETAQKKSVASVIPRGVQCTPMAKPTKPEKIQLRPTDTDFAIIQAGMKKHGADMSQVLRMALRRLAEADGLKVAG
jgi:hypothetical protein